MAAAVAKRRKEQSETKEPTSLLDSHKEIIYPLDYSFKAVSVFSDILKEKSRSRDSKAVYDLADDDEASPLEAVKATALRVNNNMLASWEGFIETLDQMIIEPHQHLQWLDLSFNDLKTIDEALLQLPNLTMIYLHGNNIKRLKEVDKLVALTRLKSLSLHGNPIESVSGYRQYIVTHIPQLQTVDFSGVTKADRKVSDVWVKMMIGKDSKETKKPKMTME
ncbi:PREDICTED: leucine-rich repeat-containing protein 51-like [Amphimedon queenslandica]|nr:PREDICTED: leucine-rich repeat-containing protein 51-like [Amphimedon queenslandica]|eukprot:XP_011404021.1 PREDICTED: leucine-rich repeat-containing protein 51-like [Amphimedon queenslandica]